MKRLPIVFGLMLIAASAVAVDASHLPTPKLDARYHTLTTQFRCLVCQGETIEASNAGLAVDMRTQVRRMLLAGKSNQDIINYMVKRYGDFVLYKPPVQTNTLALWLGPFFLLLIALVSSVFIVRKRAAMNRKERALQ